MEGFAKIAQYLQDPLILAGFVAFLFFGFARLMLKQGLVPQLSQMSGYRILRQFLYLGFIVAILVIVLGFALRLSGGLGEEVQQTRRPAQNLSADCGVAIQGDVKSTTINNVSSNCGAN